jgi:hypothetical protein
MSVAEVSVLPLSEANGEEPDPETLVEQMKLVLKNQRQLAVRVQENTDHVLKLHQMHDPLTWRKRAAIMFAGTFAGSAVASFLMHLTVHVATR